MRTVRAYSLIVVAASALACGCVQASPWTGGMLYDRFGVTLEIELHEFAPGQSVYRFSHDWTPTGTPHPLAAFHYVVNDFYGWPSDGSIQGSPPTHTGGTVINDPYSTTPTWPAGGEVYDTEAIYMTNDEKNIYIAIVTSFPPPPGYLVPSLGITVATGDLAIHTPDGDYWYGVDVNLADRAANQFQSPPLSDDVGQGLYHTQGTGWYATNLRNAVAAPHPDTGLSPHTNFYGGGMPDRYVGDVVVEYLYTGLHEGYDPEQNLDPEIYSTWEVNFTIPLRLLPEYYSLEDGQSRDIGFHFIPGCRNDGNHNDYILRLDGKVQAVPEPGTLALTALGLLGLAYLRRRRLSNAEPA